MCQCPHYLLEEFSRIFANKLHEGLNCKVEIFYFKPEKLGEGIRRKWERESSKEREGVVKKCGSGQKKGVKGYPYFLYTFIK